MSLLGFLTQWKLDWAAILSMVSVLDMVTLVIFITGIFFGMTSGLTKVLPKFFEVIAAQLITLELYQGIAAWIHARVPVPVVILEMGAFVALAMLSFVASRFFLQILGLVAKLEFQPLANSTGGAVLNGIRYVFLFSLVSVFLLMFPFRGIKETYEHSISGYYLKTLSVRVHGGLISLVPREWRIFRQEAKN